MGFWETIEGIGNKVPEILNSVKELSKNEKIQESLGNAGTIGNLCLIGLEIYKQIKKDLQTPEKEAFGALINIVFEATKEVLPQSDKIELKKEGKGLDFKREDLIAELFDIFKESDYKWGRDLPSHPVIESFRKHMRYIIQTNNQYNEEVAIDLTKFFIDFNILLESKATKDENIKKFYERSALRELASTLREYLEYVRSMKDELNPIDNKSFMDYYVENRAVVVSKDTWYKEDKDIHFDKQWKVESFLNGKEWRIVIGAPFGIGKTSLAKHIAIDYASKYLYDPGGEYIPVFVSLRDKLKNVFYDKTLDYVLDKIIAPEAGKNRKILLVCDGLDEYRDEIKTVLQYLERKLIELTNMKVIITTRLKAGLPQIEELRSKTYVRLLPLKPPEQVNEFFQKYYETAEATRITTSSSSSINFETIQKYGLKEEEICKPLFCWMLAIVHPASGSVIESIEDKDIKRSMIYQEFVHSTIRGKYARLAISDYDYSEYDIDKEKKLFRKIAALKMIYGNSLTENIVIRDLAKFEDKLIAENEEIRTVLDPIISSYFYLESSASDPKLDFIHESFKEYLLAEYYIESLLTNEPKPYHLNVGIPSYETVTFVDGLLKLISIDNNKNIYILTPYINRFLKSLSVSQEEQIEKAKAISTIITNVQKSIENENIVFHKENKREEKELWITSATDFTKYEELWIYRWISLFILTTLTQNSNIDKEIDKEKISLLVHTTSKTTPYYLKKMVKIDLSNANLSGADLFIANLSGANLSNADLFIANLSGANLENALLPVTYKTTDENDYNTTG